MKKIKELERETSLIVAITIMIVTLLITSILYFTEIKPLREELELRERLTPHIKISENSLSIWANDGELWNHYICVGEVAVNNKLVSEIAAWNRTIGGWISNCDNFSFTGAWTEEEVKCYYDGYRG